MTTRILLIDAKPYLREQLELAALGDDHELISAHGAAEAFQSASENAIDLAIVDARLPGIGGEDLFQQLALRLPGVAVIALIPDAASDTTRSALDRGAYDVVAPPLSTPTLAAAVRRARERRNLLQRSALIQREWMLSNRERPIVAASEPMIALLENMERAAGGDDCVLLVGEAGTGKETLARAIHAQSSRRRSPFVTVSCRSSRAGQVEAELFDAAPEQAGMDRGLLAMADGGTLFLDEIGDLDPAVQERLERFLANGTYYASASASPQRSEVCVIAATTRDLAAEAAGGRFSPQLLDRLAIQRLEVPALRERRRDIPLLFDHFLAHYRARLGRPIRSISDQALEQLVRYAWPGNTRELENLVARAVMIAEAPRIEVTDLPEGLGSNLDECEPETLAFALKPARKALEARLIRRALRATRGNRTHAARLLDVSHRALLYKIKEYGIRELPPLTGRRTAD